MTKTKEFKSAFAPYDTPYNKIVIPNIEEPVKVSSFIEFLKRGDFVTYYEPVVKANVLINIQDYYLTSSRILNDNKKYKRWIYYKAFNLERNHLYYDGSKLGIIFEEYDGVRYATHDEINRYMETLKKENLTL